MPPVLTPASLPVSDGALAIAATNGLQTALDAKAARAGARITGATPIAVDQVQASLLIDVPNLQTNGVVVKVAAGTPTYGKGQAFLVVEEGTGNATDQSAAGSALFRVDELGNVGMQGGMHIAPGARKTTGMDTTQAAVWITPEIDGPGLSIGMKPGVATKDAIQVFGTAAPQLSVKAWAVNHNGIVNWYGNDGTTALAAIYPQTSAPFGFRAFFAAGQAATIPLFVQGAASQTADLFPIYSSGSAILSRFNKAGYFMTRKTTAPADADLANGEMAVWFDPTNGAAKLMIKAKETSGTVRTGSVALT